MNSRDREQSEKSGDGQQTAKMARRLGFALVCVLLASCAPYHATAPSIARENAQMTPVGQDRSRSHVGVDCRKAKCVALTFDAGPSKHTPRLLRILRKEHVHATFFLLGKGHITKHPELVKRIADGGHEVANHTWTHQILTDVDDARVESELSRTQNAVQRLTGRKSRLMRPPQGRTDDRVARISKRLGLAEVLWSVTAKDYATTDTALIRQRVLDQTDRDGIILLHDLYDGTVPAVPGIIDQLKKRGYTFVTVPELLAPAQPRPGAVYKP